MKNKKKNYKIYQLLASTRNNICFI